MLTEPVEVMLLVVSSACMCMDVNILSPVLKGITSGMFQLIISNLNQLMKKKLVPSADEGPE